ncbi:reverse transcriptase domain-containing protein [Tanacetum coccineum]
MKEENISKENLRGMDKEFKTRPNGILCIEKWSWLPRQGGLRNLIMNESHKSKYSIYLGFDKMYHDLKKLYWWPNMKAEIATYVRTSFRFHPFQFFYPPTMEDILYKFIDEGRRENKEMRAFIREFKTTNELLLKEINNSLSELKFEVYRLSKAINDAQLSNYKVKGVTTRGGKTTTENILDTNDKNKEPPLLHHAKPIEPHEVLVETKPQEVEEQTVKPPAPLIPFPHRLEEAYIVMNERRSVVLLNKLPSKEKHLGSFIIPCNIGHLHINNALADLGASISLMPYMMYEKLGRGEPKPTRMRLELADRSIQYSRGIAENVLIKIDKFILPIDFVILDMREDSKTLIILGRPFLATARAMIDVFNKNITLRVGNKKETKRPDKTQNEHLYSASANEIDEKIELKDLPSHLEYAYLKGDESCLVIISSKLTENFTFAGIRKMQGINCLEDVRHKGNKSVILHTQDLNGEKLQTYHSILATLKSESPRRG